MLVYWGCVDFKHCWSVQLPSHRAYILVLTQPQKGFPSNDYNAHGHTHPTHINCAPGLPPAISVGFPSSLLLPVFFSALAEGGRERRAGEAEGERSIPSSQLSPGSPSCWLHGTAYTGCSSVECAPEGKKKRMRCGHDFVGKDTAVETQRDGGKGIRCARRSAEKVVRETGHCSMFPRKGTRKGDGALKPRMPEKGAFLRCVTALRTSQTFVPTRC